LPRYSISLTIESMKIIYARSRFSLGSISSKYSCIRLRLICCLYLLGINIGISNRLNGQAIVRYDGFESYEVGATEVDYWNEQTCATDPCEGCGVTPFMVSDTHARVGNKSVRLMKVDDDAALTGGSYCGYRAQFSNYHDAIFSYNEHAWIGFSVYIADHHLTDQWAQNNIWVFQFKNVDAGGGGNQFGSIKSYDKRRDGRFLYYVEGLGDIGAVELNAWTDFVVHIYYSTQADGMVEVWKNGEHFSASGALPAKKECYLTFNIYGDKMDPKAPANEIYFDEIRFLKDTAPTAHVNEVAPGLDTTIMTSLVDPLNQLMGVSIQLVSQQMLIKRDLQFSTDRIRFYLYDITGRKKLEHTIIEGETVIPLYELDCGVYIVHMIDGKGKRYTKKILLNSCW